MAFKLHVTWKFHPITMYIKWPKQLNMTQLGVFDHLTEITESKYEIYESKYDPEHIKIETQR